MAIIHSIPCETLGREGGMALNLPYARKDQRSSNEHERNTPGALDYTADVMRARQQQGTGDHEKDRDADP